LQVISTKKEKEELVVKLYQDGKTIREIAAQAHLSFGTIGKIISLLNGVENNDTISSDMNNKSKTTQALSLFSQGKRPIEVAIKLDLPASKIEDILQEFWVLNKLDELALVYLEIKYHLDLFLNLFHIMKKNKLINEKDIKTILKHASDLPSLKNKFRSFANAVLELEIKKKELSTQLFHLGLAINQYQNVIDIKKEKLL
jgi:transposase